MSDYKPASKIRQPRILYHIDDPEMAQVEKLRAYGSARNLNAIYTEALRLGAEILLQRLEQNNAYIPRKSHISAPAPVQVYPAVIPALAPVPAPVPAPVQAVSPESDPPPVVIPPMPAEPRIKPSLSAAALAQFQRFGN